MTDIPFSGSPLDRADHIRKDERAVDALRQSPDARFLLFDDLKVVLGGDGHALYWATRAEVPPDAPCVFLGLKDGEPRFAVAVSPAVAGGNAVDAYRAAGALLDGRTGIIAAARSLLLWHKTHPFCAACGTPTRMAKGGWARICPSCGTEVYPRVDPVVIMLPEYEDRILIGRQPGFPKRFWSALAGFVEPGETFEEAVRREVLEEAGVHCGDVTYVGSQPWPFAASLMLGAFAEARDGHVKVDHDELEAVRWVGREEVIAALNGEAEWTPPNEIAIARHLLSAWVNRQKTL